MDDALGVRVGERVRDLDGEVDRAPRVERASRDDGVERRARHVLEREKELPLILADFVERRDGGVRQRHRRARVLEEALAAGGVVDHLGRDHFHGDRASEACVARAEQLAHSAGADAIENLVLPERLEH